MTDKLSKAIDERIRTAVDAKQELIASLKKNAKKVSSCCGAPDRCTTPVGVKDEGPYYYDVGQCPKCKEHCEFVDEKEEQI